MQPAEYDAWYQTPRGAWIGNTEFHLLVKMLQPIQGHSLLDIGCGTGYFSRRFASSGFDIIALDPDEAMLAHAHAQDKTLCYLRGDARNLPFRDKSVDYCTSVTSLCFVDDPQQAIQEMLRVSRCSIIIGLLNRHSRLYHQKFNQALIVAHVGTR